jgi:prepilin-type processing-associated H-X9-DG protein
MSNTNFLNFKHKYNFNFFTLVELLVIIAVIAILVSILLPALKKARSKAYQITCTNNFKNISHATNLYSSDYGGYLIPAYMGSSVQGLGGWYKYTEMYLPYSKTSPNKKGIYFCLSSKLWFESSGSPVSNYAWNANLGSEFMARQPKQGQITHPSSLFVVADAGFPPNQTPSYPQQCVYRFGLDGGEILADRSNFGLGVPHNLGSNISFADGHVAWFKIGTTEAGMVYIKDAGKPRISW